MAPGRFACREGSPCTIELSIVNWDETNYGPHVDGDGGSSWDDPALIHVIIDRFMRQTLDVTSMNVRLFHARHTDLKVLRYCT